MHQKPWIPSSLPALVVAVLTLTALAPVVAGAAESRTVELKSADGFTLKATQWQNTEKGPGILLLHQCNSDRTMYDELGAKLADAGYRVLAPDLRGFGDSKSDEFSLGKTSSPEDWERAKAKWGTDVEVAYEALGNVVGALGASCGGGEVIRLATAHPEIARVGLLSSRLSAIEERDAMRLPSQKLLLIAGKGDTAAVRPAGTLAYRKRDATTLMLFEGEAHGYPLFEQEPDLIDSIVEWFEVGVEASR